MAAESPKPVEETKQVKIEPNTATSIPKPARDCPCDDDDLAGEKVKGVAMEMETNEDALIGYFRSHGFKVQKGLGKRREVLDPDLEVPLFRYPPLTHLQCLPDETRSKVSVTFSTSPRLASDKGESKAGVKEQFRIN